MISDSKMKISRSLKLQIFFKVDRKKLNAGRCVSKYLTACEKREDSRQTFLSAQNIGGLCYSDKQFMKPLRYLKTEKDGHLS